MGWFTAIHPVQLPADADVLATVDIARETIRGAPHDGISFGSLRYLINDPALDALPSASVCFSHLGALAGGRTTAEGRLKWIDRDVGDLRDPRQPRRHALTVNTHLDGNSLVASFSAPSEWGVASIQALVDAFADVLREALDRILEAPPVETSDDEIVATPEMCALVVGAWSEVLGIETIGLDEDFFVLGGDSVSMIQVVSRLRRGAGIRIPLRTMFDHPTVRQLANAIEVAIAERPDNGTGREHT